MNRSVTSADYSAASERMLLTEIGVAHKLIDAARRTNDRDKAERFLTLAGAACFELSLQPQDVQQTAAELPAIRTALQGLNERLADCRATIEDSVS